MDSDIIEISSEIYFKDDCLKGIILPVIDRYIFWIGGSITLIASFFLILSYIKFKELRKQPGDLILGIALSDFLLSLHWVILATWHKEVDHQTFCLINGSIGVIAGLNEFLYNIAFSLYLLLSLKNALKQVKIPRNSFHIFNVCLTSAVLGHLLYEEKIGKTLAGTCSLKATCSEGFTVSFGPVLALFYAFLGCYTYYYIQKNAPRCKRVHNKRTNFLLYYLRYIALSSVLYIIIAAINVASTILVRPKDLRKHTWLISVFNISKLFSPLLLTFFRYNDPVIKKAMIKTLLFWRSADDKLKEPLIRKEIEKPVELHVLNNIRGATSSNHPNPKGFNRLESQMLSNRSSFEDEFAVNELSLSKKMEITYTLLSCVLYGYRMEHESTMLTNTLTYERKPDNPYKHQVVHFLEEDAVLQALPSVKKELERTKYNILPGSLKIYCPEIFTGFLMDDQDFLNIMETLDFNRNRERIRAASGGDGGKSGEFFFFSYDKKLLLKTVPDSEMRMLISILSDYRLHFHYYPNTLIAKIYGAFTYENTDDKLKFNIVVMKNVCGFNSTYVERVYDLKGSKYDREVLKAQEISDRSQLRNSVLKDIDFERFEAKLNIKHEIKQAFMKQIDIDSNFFRRNKLIDYSFMVFVVNKRRCREERGDFDDFTTRTPYVSLENIREEGMYYNVGIIDYLQPYNFKKALEKFFKRLRALNPNLETSTQNPAYYSQRFIKFIRQIVE